MNPTPPLTPGQILLVEGSSRLAWLITWFQTRWARRQALLAGWSILDIWSLKSRISHIAMIVQTPRQSALYVGEALATGNVLTPLQTYHQALHERKITLHIANVINSTPAQGIEASNQWFDHIYNHPYDFSGYPVWSFRALIADLLWLPCGRKHHFQCAEGPDLAWRRVRTNHHSFNICADRNPTPYHFEQASNLLPQRLHRPITLEIVWSSPPKR